MTTVNAKLLRSVMNNVSLPVTRGMSQWRTAGSPITQEAWEKVSSVIEKESFDNSRVSGKGRIRPSLIGDTCPRKHMLSYLGIDKATPSDGSFDVMSAGTWGHYRWQLAGLSQGWLKDIEVQVSYEPWKIQGAMDGIIFDNSVFELKTTSGFKFKSILENNIPVTAHLMQTHAYMKALDLTHFSIVYENRDNAVWKEFRIERMQNIDDDLENLMLQLQESIDLKELPQILPSCAKRTGSAYNYCDWRDTCRNAVWSD